ncbi:hypothetical protein [Catenulispora rubra]|uniref:hypothetical protein n=1 Tax=Catenulispora rubra TaxID=280293 RepID=UPI0018924745|nr:hypothetical protein [Catenulispora rubra]
MLSRSTPCCERAWPISPIAEETAAEVLNGAVGLVVIGGDVGVVVGGVVGVVGAVVGGVVGDWLGEVGPDGGGCDWLGGGCEGRGEEDDIVGVCTVNGDGLVEFVVGAAKEDVAVLLGAAGESEADDVGGEVTLTYPGAALPPPPGDSGGIRFGAPSRTVEVDPAGLCRIPGATKANAAMAAVDRLPMAIGVGRSGLNGLRARWRAL